MTTPTCSYCKDAGSYYDPADRDPIEGFKLATPRLCTCLAGLRLRERIAQRNLQRAQAELHLIRQHIKAAEADERRKLRDAARAAKRKTP